MAEKNITPGRDVNKELTKQVRRSERTKATDANRSKFSNDPTHRELSLGRPKDTDTIRKATSVEQLVQQFDRSPTFSGTIPKKPSVPKNSIAEQSNKCFMA